MQLEDTMQEIERLADGKLLAGRIGAVGVLLLNQPAKLNAISVEMWEGIAQTLDRFENDAGVRTVLYAGAGGRAFASGADISQFAEKRSNAEANAEYNRIAERGRAKLIGMTKPSIACIQGYCLGGGLVIALQADLRIASDDAQFGIPAARMGIAYGIQPTEKLVQLIGPSRTRLMLYTARRYGATEALAMGLADQVFPVADVVRESVELARTIADNAPLSVQASKFTVEQALRQANERDRAGLDAWTRRCMDSADYREGRTAFTEKRKPIFTGA